MSFRTKMRLYLINLSLFPSGSEENQLDSADLLTVSAWNSPADTVSGLKELGWVSDLYGLTHLSIDRWYLARRSSGPLPDFCTQSSDPSSILLFRIILQALRDLQTGRPCDLGIWVADEPPDSRRCQVTEHLCFQNAERYLTELGDVECLINLSPSFLKSLVIRIKKDPIFRGR